jgi:hypothetical protein
MGEDSRSHNGGEHGALSPCVCQKAVLIVGLAPSNGAWGHAEASRDGGLGVLSCESFPHISCG